MVINVPSNVHRYIYIGIDILALEYTKLYLYSHLKFWGWENSYRIFLHTNNRHHVNLQSLSIIFIYYSLLLILFITIGTFCYIYYGTICPIVIDYSYVLCYYLVSNNQEDHNMKESFIQVERKLLRAAGFISEDGELVPITPTDKWLYVYIRDRVNFFVNERKGNYFETHETISEATATARKTVVRFVDKFITAGVIVAKKEKKGRYYGYSYKVVHPLNLYFNQTVIEKGNKTIPLQEYQSDDNPIPEILR